MRGLRRGGSLILSLRSYDGGQLNHEDADRRGQRLTDVEYIITGLQERFEVLYGMHMHVRSADGGSVAEVLR